MKHTAAAPSVGHGVPKIRSKQSTDFDGALTDQIENLPIDDLSDEWDDVPTTADQLSDPKLWKPVKQEAKVFDLSDAAQLKEYNDLLTSSKSPTTNLFISSSETQFVQATASWKVLAHVVTIKYRKLIGQKAKK